MACKNCRKKIKFVAYDSERKPIMNITAQIITGAVLAALLAAVLIRLLFFRRRRTAAALEDMEGHEFEYFCADLLKNHGFTEVEVTRGSGDYGIDILAEKDGVTYAIQCKRYTSPVGVKAVQEAYAGRDYYDRMVGAVMTNQYFTTPAVEAARKLKILLWDGGYVESMMEEE
jgi:restriction system protein